MWLAINSHFGTLIHQNSKFQEEIRKKRLDFISHLWYNYIIGNNVTLIEILKQSGLFTKDAKARLKSGQIKVNGEQTKENRVI